MILARHKIWQKDCVCAATKPLKKPEKKTQKKQMNNVLQWDAVVDDEKKNFPKNIGKRFYFSRQMESIIIVDCFFFVALTLSEPDKKG